MKSIAFVSLIIFFATPALAANKTQLTIPINGKTVQGFYPVTPQGNPASDDRAPASNTTMSLDRSTNSREKPHQNVFNSNAYQHRGF